MLNAHLEFRIIWCGWDGFQGCGSVAPVRVPFSYYGIGKAIWTEAALMATLEFSPFCQFSVSLATSKLSFLQAHACAKDLPGSNPL